MAKLKVEDFDRAGVYLVFSSLAALPVMLLILWLLSRYGVLGGGSAS